MTNATTVELVKPSATGQGEERMIITTGDRALVEFLQSQFSNEQTVIATADVEAAPTRTVGPNGRYIGRPRRWVQVPRHAWSQIVSALAETHPGLVDEVDNLVNTRRPARPTPDTTTLPPDRRMPGRKARRGESPLLGAMLQTPPPEA